MKSKSAFMIALLAIGGALIGLGIMAQQSPEAHTTSALQANSHGLAAPIRRELAQAVPAGMPDSTMDTATAEETAPVASAEETEAAPSEETSPDGEATPESGSGPEIEAGEDFLDDEIVIINSDGEARGASTGIETNDENLINIHLDDVEMVDVVRMFTQISGINIIATPSNLQGRVTVSLTGVEWKPALESILDMHGLSLIEKRPDSDVYSIVTKIGDIEPMSTETIFLKYSSVSSVNEVVKGLLPAGASSTAFPSRGALVLRTTSTSMAEIHKIIDEIDKLREQAFIEAKFMELSDAAIKDLGIDWQSLAGTTVRATSLSDAYTETTTWDKTRADDSTTYDIRRSFRGANHGYDTGGSEVGDLMVTETDFSPVTDLAGVTPTFTYLETVDRGESLNSSVSDAFSSSITDVKTAVLSASDFQLVLAALKQTEGVSIVSNPKIVVANEEPAVIHIGQIRRPFVSSVTPGQQGIAPIVTYNPGEEVRTGVELTVTPTINTSSNITLRISPRLSRIDGEDVAPDQQTYPITSEKTIETVFTLESGKTVAIGGLTEVSESEEESKIPLLGDIPLIGKYLFSYRHEERRQVETIIFVTVSLARPETIDPEAGFPVDTELTKKRMIVEEIRRREIKEEIDDLKDATDEDMTLKDERVKDRLLRKIED